MSSYGYEAVDSEGLKIQGTLDVEDQSEAVRRIKEMGLFPTRVDRKRRTPSADRSRKRSAKNISIEIPLFSGRVKASVLVVFTRQLATLLDAGMPLLRGLRILHEQTEHTALKRVINEIAAAIEGGSSLSEALSMHPKIFSPLYINMVKAGELGGALETTLGRLAEFMEKAQKIKGKVVAAMFYPASVLVVAAAIMALLTILVIPRFREIFEGMLPGGLPAFTRFVFAVSSTIQHHFLQVGAVGIVFVIIFCSLLRTRWGRRGFDQLKLSMPIFGPVFRKLAIARFSRTLGTLLSSGVPVLQALTIVKETTGNVVVSRVVETVHDSVKQGDTMAVPLKASGVFPAMVAGMVDIGEQTGSLPDMLIKVASGYDDEVDNAVSAMTSLLEPIMLVMLAIIVGAIVIAMFLPIIRAGTFPDGPAEG